ncbi:MAG: ABC transporter ATP-binding protein [Clostridia bacterium]|nr:ABC transporter ATP-binding protein [Clostridia bacterium]
MIILDNVTKKFGKKRILNSFSLTVQKGESVAVMGPSGSGKTTLLRIMAGLERCDKGSVQAPVCAVVFQDPTLLDWLTALENVSLVTDNSEENAKRLLGKLGFTEDDMNKKPPELSGGMKQRVSIARALNFSADCYLFDEAFKGLDDELRFSVISTVKEEIKGKTAVFVTHSLDEANKLGTRIITV